ncbi:MAG: toprim domain-containing protein, partial [candidate division Zixibacteria bacterium]|nr:toprim domain-containing protein [candidate division Zixibacteria bacterium]
KKDLSPQDLAEAGLAIKSEKRQGDYFDRFRLRLMIPIFNLAGKIIAFGGRALSKKEMAKYMNSPETPIYSKSHILYGLHASKGAIRESGAAIMVEGYFDFLSLFQAGIHNVVAVAGTAFTPQQAKLLGRFARNAYLFFDADSAGQNAAIRSIEHFYNAGIEPMIATPPPGYDPDSLVRKFGATEVLRQIGNRQSYLAFRFKRKEMGPISMQEKDQAVRDVKALAAKVDYGVGLGNLLASAVDVLQLPVNFFHIGQSVSSRPIAVDRPRSLNLIESEFLSLFFMEPSLIETVWDDISPDDLKGPGNSSIFAAMIRSYKQDGKIDSERLSKEMTGETERSLLTYIAAYDEWGKIDPTSVVKEYKRVILNQKREQQLTRLKVDLGEAEKKGDRATAEKLTREIKYLLEKRR